MANALCVVLACAHSLLAAELSLQSQVWNLAALELKDRRVDGGRFAAPWGAAEDVQAAWVGENADDEAALLAVQQAELQGPIMTMGAVRASVCLSERFVCLPERLPHPVLLGSVPQQTKARAFLLLLGRHPVWSSA
jgi:hypothetical protein